MPYSERLAEAYIAQKDKERAFAAKGEDPLFTAMAGDSDRFIGKMPEKVWNQMSPEAQRQWTEIPESAHDNVRAIGSVAGAAPGIMIAPINPYVGGALGVYGGSRGYDAADKWLKNNTPEVLSRDELQRRFESVKGQE